MNSFRSKGQPESDGFRYEKKYLIEGMSAKDVITALKRHPSMFSELYPARYVNNIYLDTPLLSDYFSNVNGNRSRKKVRVRWYHDLFRQVDDALLEFKLKAGEVGSKEQYPFPSFAANESLTECKFRNIVTASGLPSGIKQRLRGLEFAIMNRYQRWYFATPGKEFRATVDANLEFYHLGKLQNRFKKSYKEQNYLVLEIKYAINNDHGFHRVSSALPFRITRSSKYIAGIEHVYI